VKSPDNKFVLGVCFLAARKCISRLHCSRRANTTPRVQNDFDWPEVKHREDWGISKVQFSIKVVRGWAEPHTISN
jgi:hypothetical protein